MRSIATLLTLTLSLACAAESSDVSEDAAAGYPGLTEAGATGEAGAVQVATGGARSGAGGAGTGGLVGVGGSASAGAGGAVAVDPYDRGNGRRCPTAVLDLQASLAVSYDGEVEYGAEGACHFNLLPRYETAIYVDYFQVSAEFNMQRVAPQDDSCAELTLIPSDGGATSCVTVGWYSDAGVDGVQNFFESLPDDYWMIVKRSEKVVRSSESVCPDRCPK